MNLQDVVQWRGEILTVVFGVFGVAGTWIGWKGLATQKRALPRKAFGLGALTKVVFDGLTERADEFEVRFRGSVVTRVTENHAFFMNTGNVEITAEDFLRPAALVFETTERILDCKVIASKPVDLHPKVTSAVEAGTATITLEPLLLNPGDFIAVSFLRAGKASSRASVGRIKGVSALDQLQPGQYASWFMIYPLTMAMVGLLFFGMAYAAYIGALPGQAKPAGLAGLAPGFIGLMFIGAAIVHRIQWRDFRLASYMGKGTEYLEFKPLISET